MEGGSGGTVEKIRVICDKDWLDFKLNSHLNGKIKKISGLIWFGWFLK